MAIRKVIPRSLDSAAASANLSFDANTLFVDSTNNAVGINTATPNTFAAGGLSTFTAANSTLAIVSGNANAYLRLYSTSDTDMYLSNTAGKMTFTTAATARMTIDSSGNVGIGTSSPGQKLEISGGSIRTINNTSGRITFNNGTTEAFVGFTGSGSTTLDAGALPLSINAQGANYIALSNNSTERMRIDSSGNVGIGTTSPSAPLEVNGTATAVRATSAQLWLNRTTAATHYQGICLRNGAVSDAFIGRPPASDNIIFGFDAGTVLSEKMRIDTNGNVGIGTTSPTQALTVNGQMLSIASSGASFKNITPTTGNNYMWLGNTGNNLYVGKESSAGGTLFVGSSAYAAVIGNDGAYPLQFATNNNVRATIDSSGNVGIGMTPTNFGNGYTVLQVANATNGGMLYLTNTANEGGRIYGNGAGITYDAFSTTYHAFNTNGNERMRITAAGKVGVATTSPSGDFAMTVADTGFCTTRINIGNVAGHLDGNTIICGSDSVNPTSWVSNASYRFGANRQGVIASINPSGYTYEGGSGGGSRTFAVNSNGNVQNSNNSYGSLSDEKLKENIVDATPKLQSLMQVKIRNFNLIADEAKTKQLGVIAQELEEVFPSMIDEHIDYTLEPYVREDGIPDSKAIPTGTTTKEVKYSVFVPMLIKAIQEQQVLIAQLQADVAALQAK